MKLPIVIDEKPSIQHISYSSLKDWVTCPWYFKLTRIDGLDKFQGNIHTAFGSAIHETIEKKLIHNQEILNNCEGLFDENKTFTDSLIKHIKSLPVEEKKKCLNDIEEFKRQGLEILPFIIPSLNEYFGENKWKLLGVEYKLNEKLDEYEYEDFWFKGFIDLVIQTEDKRIHLFDWKTTSWGWDARRKTDKMTIYQLIYYKHFYSKKNNIPLEQIDVHFALLKRTAKKDKVEFFKVTSGNKRIENAVQLLMKAVDNIDRKNWIKNRLSCEQCKYHKTVHCP